MDTKIPPASPPPSGASDGGAEKFLSDLPSRGFFSSSPTVPSSNLGGMRVYICDHDTSPPENQLIKTDQMNILIRSLLLKKQSHRTDNSKSKTVQGESSGAGRKRAAEKLVALGKRAATGDGEAETQRISGDSLQGLTVERLRMVLREKGLSAKGKKDELIARLRTANG